MPKVRMFGVSTSDFVVGNISTPVGYQVCYRKKQCKNINKPFKNKMEIAEKFAENFKAPTKCEKTYVLTDSWYSKQGIIYENLKSGYHFIGAVKSNRIIASKGIKVQLSKFAEYLESCSLDVVTGKDKEYRVNVYKGTIAK